MFNNAYNDNPDNKKSTIYKKINNNKVNDNEINIKMTKLKNIILRF